MKTLRRSQYKKQISKQNCGRFAPQKIKLTDISSPSIIKDIWPTGVNIIVVVVVVFVTEQLKQISHVRKFPKIIF